MNETVKRPPIVKMMVVIAEQDRAGRVQNILKESHIPLVFQFVAEGTASSEWLDMFGLGGTGKIVSLCLVPKERISDVLGDLLAGLDLAKPGGGIAFTMPLSGVAMPILKLLDEETRQKVKERLENEMENNKTSPTHQLVLAVINQGYSEELMEAAKAAGATGGTVFDARRIAPEDSMKFWGITVQEEKEVVALLVPQENKVPVMQAIAAKCGFGSEAQGLVLALPVDSVAGLQ